MSLGPLFLRVILILTFVLNGTTSAMAAAQMSLGQQMPQNEAMQHAAEPADDHEGMACHDDGMDAGITASGTHDQASHSIPSEQHEQSPACCDGGSCLCVCAHGMHATIPSPTFAVHAYGRIDESSVPTAGHAAPDLPHLIRPPIG